MTRTGSGQPQETSENNAEESWRESASRLIASGGKERLTLANRLTLARILMLPLLVLFLLQGSSTAHLAAGALFILSAFTDWLDGYLARRRGQITPLGEILDPVADKLLITAALLPLVAIGEVDAWIAGIILGREFLVTALRAVALKQGLVAPAGIIGKWKMGLEVAAITALILQILPPLGTVLIWAAMLAAIISAVDYFRHILRELV
ncbi:MAG: CDP-diacylglycerol--glycerol-3-phosphate 3-phosphatidyltransferase [bacterium]|nr:CDP-diacylglycerol--glycerol-3-phosphate 3-phosphatidyltransferase [bacterium]